MRLGRRDLPVFDHDRQRRRQSDQPGEPLGAAGAGNKAQGDLRQTQLEARIIRGNSVGARERDLQTAAQCQAVDRGDERLGSELHVPHAGLNGFYDRRRIGRAFEGLQFLQISADQKGLLGRGDDHTLHAGVGGQVPHGLMKFVDDLTVHEVMG